MRCEGFVAIWLHTCEDIADNRFQLLFIYSDYIIQLPAPVAGKDNQLIMVCTLNTYTLWSCERGDIDIQKGHVRPAAK